MRSTAPDAPRSAHRPPTLSANLGTVVWTVAEIQVDPNSYTVTETSRKRGESSKSGRSGAERVKDWLKNRTHEEIEKERQKDRDRKQREGEVGLVNLTTTQHSCCFPFRQDVFGSNTSTNRITNSCDKPSVCVCLCVCVCKLIKNKISHSKFEPPKHFFLLSFLLSFPFFFSSSFSLSFCPFFSFLLSFLRVCSPLSPEYGHLSRDRRLDRSRQRDRV